MHSPYKKIIVNNERELLKNLNEIEALSKEGYYLAVYIFYEAGYSLIDKKYLAQKSIIQITSSFFTHSMK